MVCSETHEKKSTMIFCERLDSMECLLCNETRHDSFIPVSPQILSYGLPTFRLAVGVVDSVLIFSGLALARMMGYC